MMSKAISLPYWRTTSANPSCTWVGRTMSARRVAGYDAVMSPASSPTGRAMEPHEAPRSARLFVSPHQADCGVRARAECPLSRTLRGNLEGGSAEPLLVARDVALQKRLQLVGGSHEVLVER